MSVASDLDEGLVGVWTSVDPFDSSVEHEVAIVNGVYVVRSADTEDREEAEVSAVDWDGEQLRYSCHWNSTGRFVKNALRRIDQDKVGLTYTYSAQDVLVRRKGSGEKKVDA